MIPEALAEEVRRRLAAGTQSMRTIARTTGVSRGTVAAIAHGRRRQRPPHPNADGLEQEPLGPIERCPECGALTHMPCRACRVRRSMGARRRRPPRQPEEDPPELDLSGPCRQRYEEIRARRMSKGWEDEEVPDG